MTDKAQEILDVAESLVRQRGYNGYSFRDLATAVGVKSSSVHYHFPSKEVLTTALVQRYRERFFASVPKPSASDASGPDLLGEFVDLYRRALGSDGAMCLCGMLGAEASVLPAASLPAVREFFAESVTWLETLFSREDMGAASQTDAHERALSTVALLQGAMIIARGSGDLSAFDAVAKRAKSAA